MSRPEIGLFDSLPEPFEVRVAVNVTIAPDLTEVADAASVATVGTSRQVL